MYLSCNMVSLAYWRMKKPTTIGSLWSIRDLLISTSYICSGSSFIVLKNLLLINLSTCDPFTYWVFVCRLRSMIWYPYELFPISFIVSATTVDSLFWSPSRRASTTFWTNVSKQRRGVYWRNQKTSFRITPFSRLKKNKSGVITGPRSSLKLEMSIFLGLDSNLLRSANSFIWSPISSCPTSQFLKIGGKSLK